MTEVASHPVTLPRAGLHAAPTPVAQTPQQKLKLRGTGADIEDVKMLEPCYHDTPMEEIKRRYHQDGVVLVCYGTAISPVPSISGGKAPRKSA